MIKGNDIIFLLDGSPVAACKSCDFSEKADVIGICNMSSKYKSYLATRHEWSLTSNHLVSSFSSFHNLVGKTFDITIGSVISDGIIAEGLSGKVTCTGCKVTATRGNMAQGSFTFIGNGELINM